MIIYKDIKELPNHDLHELFIAVGWSSGYEDKFKNEHFNVPFKNSTIVFSAWNQDKLVGCVRVISDKVVRSIIEDLAILPEYQGRGIGKELLKRCIDCFPKSEWVVCTTKDKKDFYKKCGFKEHDGTFLYIPSLWF